MGLSGFAVLSSNSAVDQLKNLKTQSKPPIETGGMLWFLLVSEMMFANT